MLALVIHHDDPAQPNLHVLEAELLHARDHVLRVARGERPTAHSDVMSVEVQVPFRSMSLAWYGASFILVLDVERSGPHVLNQISPADAQRRRADGVAEPVRVFRHALGGDEARD